MDRPPELRGVGANQTIDQVELFGDKVRLFVELIVDVGDNESWRGDVCRTVRESLGPRPGPVHLNVAFREPTVPVSDDGRSRAEEYTGAVEGRPGEGPWQQFEPLVLEVAPDFPYAASGLVIAGDGVYDRGRLAAAADDLGWPVLATSLSGLRGRTVIDSYHHLLAGKLSEDLRPEVVVAVGHTGPSTRLDSLFGSASTRIRVDAWGRSIDPGRDATHKVHADPVELLRRFGPPAPDRSWTETWGKRAAAVRASLVADLEDRRMTSGAGVAHALSKVDWGSLVVGSSLPIREVDAHMTRPGPVVANRGASGIDGIISTALGTASKVPRTLAMVGDLSLLHDANGFLIDSRRDLTIVVINNGGGGLFDSLPQARHAPDYERLFVTPHGRELSDFARFHHVDHEVVTEPGQVEALVTTGLGGGGITLIEVVVDREHDLATRTRHDEIGRSVQT
jgi:2-succinyl-5-enolpyruvyl-6-hydroxy-3-cyclohexene-1-carboxylate synthase